MGNVISGNLEEDSRVIVFDEVTGSIEHNELTASGTYEVSGLTENNKTIISRNSEGEAYGYGNVTPAQGGPVYEENFDTGIDDWTSSGHGSTTWYNNDSMQIECITGGNAGRYVIWNVGVAGDFDVETYFTNNYLSGGAGDIQYFSAMMSASSEVSNWNNYIRIENRSNGGSFFNMFRANSQWVKQEWNGSPTFWNGNFRFTRVGDIYRTYYDDGDDGWQLAQETEHSGWTTMYLKFSVSVYGAGIRQRIHHARVNDGTII